MPLRPLRCARSRKSTRSRTSGAARILSQAQEIHLDLHGIIEPAKNVDIIPAFLVIAAWFVVMDMHLVLVLAVEILIQFRLQECIRAPTVCCAPWCGRSQDRAARRRPDCPGYWWKTSRAGPVAGLSKPEQ